MGVHTMHAIIAIGLPQAIVDACTDVPTSGGAKAQVLRVVSVPDVIDAAFRAVMLHPNVFVAPTTLDANERDVLRDVARMFHAELVWLSVDQDMAVTQSLVGAALDACPENRDDEEPTTRAPPRSPSRPGG